MKKVFISGGSEGIGLALARRFHAAGYEVGICGRNEHSLKKARKEMKGLLIWQADLSIKAETKALGQKILKEMGCPDILINNAGVFQPGLVTTEEDEVYETLMRTNMDSAYYLTKSLSPAMIARKTGTIVNMCSIAGLQAYPNGGSYCISKFALVGFSKVLREEMKVHNIRVIAVMPGAVYTRSWEPSGIPPERMMPPEDIAEAVFSACSLSSRTVVEEIVLRPQEGDI